jgi:hypothetical protein
MATTNPYDRRTNHPRELYPHEAYGSMTPVREVARGLMIEDLHAMAESARTRGEFAMAERLADKHDAALQSARRATWEEGYKTGWDDLCVELTRRYKLMATRAHDRGREVLQKLGAEPPEDVPMAEVELALDNAVDVLTDFLSGYGDGFTPKEG